MNTEPPTPSNAPGALGRATALARRHPITVGIVVLGALMGAVAGYWLPIDRSLPFRLVGGAIMGAWFALFPIGARLLQGDD